jgi:hypothetical protein
VAADRAVTIALSKKMALARKRTAISSVAIAEVVEAEVVEAVRPRSCVSGCQGDPRAAPSWAPLSV